MSFEKDSPLYYINMSNTKIETFQIGSHTVPRLFVGLWQCSSPSWGSAPLSKIKKHFQALVDAGFTAYDMADHYGDAELLFGRFRTQYKGPSKIYCATKICLFEQVDPTAEVMDAALAQRVKNVKAEEIDLCQFYIQHYPNGEHLKALRYLDDDARVSCLGAVNFDTAKMEQALAAGIAIATNQVQFSLIDSRPTIKMGPLCQTHGVKLLTYGTLCGGFLADKWLGEPAPALYSDGMTPSHRKYFEEIEAWGGWDLFQSLLEALQVIAVKHSVSISNVATRWVLDHEYVGAVIVGTRLGISDRTAENLKAYGWRLDEEDSQRVEEVLQRSRRGQMFEQMGDSAKFSVSVVVFQVYRVRRAFKHFATIGRKHKAHRQGDKPSQGKGKNSDRGKAGKGKNWRKMGQEESTLIDARIPSRTLESRTVEGVAKYLRDGRAKKVVVMVGAGISTSAGIPDFRSPDTGLYANLARLNLPFAEAVFDISYFRDNPLPFYALAQELYPGKYRPTITHSFIKLLDNKGILLKLFTQNIDCLEREVGVPDDKIVEAHGSFARQRCIECKSSYPDDKMRRAIQDQTVPRCLDGDCNGLVKPDIVFFGEALPSAFFDNRFIPADADLAIVMGTSLTVQPFATLPDFVSENIPRVLLNKEQVGTLGSRSDDILMLGDCDDGVRKLAKACGWLEELEELWRKSNPQAAADLLPGEEKTKDELVEEEINQLTKDVAETLRASSSLLRDESPPPKSHSASAPAPEPEKVLENSPDMGNVLDTSADGQNEVVAAPEQMARNVTPTVPQKHLNDGGLAHVFPHMGSKSAL